MRCPPCSAGSRPTPRTPPAPTRCSRPSRTTRAPSTASTTSTSRTGRPSSATSSAAAPTRWWAGSAGSAGRPAASCRSCCRSSPRSSCRGSPTRWVRAAWVGCSAAGRARPARRPRRAAGRPTAARSSPVAWAPTAVRFRLRAAPPLRVPRPAARTRSRTSSARCSVAAPDRPVPAAPVTRATLLIPTPYAASLGPERAVSQRGPAGRHTSPHTVERPRRAARTRSRGQLSVGRAGLSTCRRRPQVPPDGSGRGVGRGQRTDASACSATLAFCRSTR